jgi:hypothetical protein
VLRKKRRRHGRLTCPGPLLAKVAGGGSPWATPT